ncbi:MAG: GNAT family N-acetyltransferase, partial [Hyphomicrobiales bacterium]
MEFVIRDGKRADIPRLSDIERDAALRFVDVNGYRFCVGGPVRDNEEFGRGLDQGALLVGETNAGTAAGFALLWRIDGNAHLTELNVERCHQGHGLGRLLVGHAETWARAQASGRMPLLALMV